jgi:hypothetical protein
LRPRASKGFHGVAASGSLHLNFLQSLLYEGVLAHTL